MVKCKRCGAEGHVSWTCPKPEGYKPPLGAPPIVASPAYPDPDPALQRTVRKSSRLVAPKPAIKPDAGGLIAPPGDCPYCDRRRSSNTAAMRERRAKEKAAP